MCFLGALDYVELSDDTIRGQKKCLRTTISMDKFIKKPAWGRNQTK